MQENAYMPPGNPTMVGFVGNCRQVDNISGWCKDTSGVFIENNLQLTPGNAGYSASTL